MGVDETKHSPLKFVELTGWCMLSGRISESVPVRRTRNGETRIRSWRTTEPRPAICTLLAFRCFSY